MVMTQRMSAVMPRISIVSLAALGVVVGLCGARAQVAPDQPVSPAMQVPLEKSRAAIDECRERRLHKEFTTYKESALCSDPKIFAAWQEAHYPHMDLITTWLNAREANSEKVDQHLMTPQQFEQQMDELTVRLTAEENRRRAGLISTPDSELTLQLPPAEKVVGVVTPAGQDRLAAKKSALARDRAALAAQHVDPSTGTTIQSMATVSAPDAQSRTPGGIGGPFVPVNPKSPAARAALARAQAAAAPGEGSSGLYAQLAAQRSEAEARLAYRALQGQYPTILGGKDAVIRRSDDGNQGTYYRVEVGPLDAGQANALCGSLKAAGAQCVARYE